MPPDPVRLNLGAGKTVIPGYLPVDIHDGAAAMPLDYPDNSVDEVRASHLLEHFSYCRTLEVLAEWFRVLKPGGVMKIAVPDFDRIITAYQAGSTEPIEGYLMGGHADRHDVHLAIFSTDKLRECMQHVGLVDVRPWTSEIADCAAKMISLNLQGTKPEATQGGDKNRPFRVYAVMSAPRYGFMDNFTSAYNGLAPFNIPFRVTKGAFWGQCLERGMLEALAAREDLDAILTLDFDTVFTADDVRRLICLMVAHPEADAIVPIQAARWRSTPLFTKTGPDGRPMSKIPSEAFAPDLMPIRTGHFGLTLIRASSLRALPHPWFKGTPGPSGNWDDGRTDDDIHFWVEWERAGKTAFLATDVAIGHIVEMIAWPGQDIQAIYQHPNEYRADGKPKDVWQ